jgi:hypothetical protein
MADVKISGLPASTVPLAGTEVLPIVQGGATKQVSIANVTAGRAISATTIQSTIATGTAPLIVASTTEVANLKSASATSADTANQVKSNATTGILQVTGPASAATRVMTTPDANFTVARTDAAQSFTGDQTLSTGNLVVGTSGKGIDFSATAGTGTSELLADYEEGNWTPSLGGDTTYFTQSGTYTKVGRMVFVRGVLVINAIGTGSTTQISGLPFANASGAVCAISVGSFFASATAVASFFAAVSNGGSVINVGSLVLAGTTEGSSAIFANNTQFQFSGCYSV